MRWTPISIMLVLASAACVKGNPDGLDTDQEFVGKGGSLELRNCGYTVTTRRGAEAPAPGRAFFGPDPTPRQVHLGISGDPRSSMAVIWRTRDDTTLASTVRFAKGRVTAPDLDRTEEGFTFQYRIGLPGGADLGRVRIHEAHLCGLEPDTEYSYQVGGGETWSPVYTFRTAPAASDRSAQVFIGVVGDSRSGYDVWQNVVDELASRAPDLILFSGDAVLIGHFQTEWDTFFDIGEELFATTPVISAHGNHDDNAVGYYSQFAMPGDEENFSLDYGFAHITILNDSPVDEVALSGSIKQFLRDDLAAHQDARWKLVMHHRPQWSSSDHGSDPTLQHEWGPIIDQYGVDLVLSGHDHNYERTVPLRAGAESSVGTVYMVSGGAGAPLYPAGHSFFTHKSERSYGAAIVDVRRETLNVEAFDQNGAQLDQFGKSKPD